MTADRPATGPDYETYPGEYADIEGAAQGAAAPPDAIAIVRELADLSVADSPEFRDPGWEDAVRALIRRARRAAQGAAAPCGHTEQQHRTLHENRVPCMAAQGAAAPPDLDVERLATAMSNVTGDGRVWAVDLNEAEKVAAEYARLSGASTDSTEDRE